MSFSCYQTGVFPDRKLNIILLFLFGDCCYIPQNENRTRDVEISGAFEAPCLQEEEPEKNKFA